MKTLPLLVCSVAILVLSRPLRADPRRPLPHTMQLEYIREPGAQACPDEEVLRSALLLSGGRDPFDPSAEATFLVKIVRSQRAQFVASIKIQDSEGVIWAQDLPPRLRCETLVQDLGREVGFFIDDAGRGEGAPKLPRTLRFEYVRGSPHCPDAQTMRDVAGGAMTYDPFVEEAKERMLVTTRRHGRTYWGRAEVRNEKGKVLWSFAMAHVDCHYVAGGLGFAIGMALDPPKPKEKPPVPAPPPKVKVVVVHTGPPDPHELPPPDEPPKRPPPRELRFVLGLDAAAALGATPANAALELRADIGARYRWFSLVGEVRYIPPVELDVASVPGAKYRASQLTGGVVPCGHVRLSVHLFGCGVVALGRFEGGVTGLAMPDLGANFVALLGGRGGVEVPLGKRVSLRVSGDVLVVPARAAVMIDGVQRWAMPLVTGAVGGGVATNL